MKKLQITLIGIFLLLGCAKEEALTPTIIDTPPSVFTEDATNVTLKSAFIVGKVQDVAYSPTIERGFIYASNADVSGYGNTIKLDTNITIFKSQLTKLTPNKTYYYKAYAKNKYGTAYGELKNFTTGDYLLPTLTTDSLGNITLTSVKLYGNITDDGETPILKRGFCISTNPTPTTTDSTFNTGNGIGIFDLIVIKLKAGTKYNVRAFATNAMGTSYGKEITFSTLEYKLPQIQTNSATDIGLNFVTLSGNVKDLGRGELKERGIVVSKSQKPTIDDMKFKSSVTDLGEYKILVTKLEVNTKYYARAYAQNEAGIIYGDELHFNTLDYKLPQIQTNTATDIGLDIATLSGNVKDLGRGELKERGIVVSKSQKPTIDNIKFKSSVTDLGEYKIVFTNLEVNTKYYARAYAQNEAGIIYGDDINFTTDNYTAPKVSTNDLQNISFTSLRAGLEVQSEGNTKVTDRGVVISTNPIPQLTDLKIQMGDGIGGEMRDITGLASNVTYYLRGYATNKWGTSYGDIRKFTTKDNTPPPASVYVAPVYTPPTPGTPPTTFTPTPVVSTPPPTLSALPEYVSVPDSRFEQALIDRGLDFVLDGRLKTASVTSITELIITNRLGISNLDGIEAFQNLRKLQIEHNNLINANISKNINLTWVSLWENDLTTLDVRALSNLQLLGISQNNISYIDISQNRELREINFQNNRDAGHPDYGISKGLLALDISKNQKMERIYLSDNRLTSLDVSNNPNLTDIWADGNKIQSLNCTKNPQLNMIIMMDNRLSYLNIKGTANNGVPRSVKTSGNPSLFEIKIDNLARFVERINQCDICYERDGQTKYVE